MCAKCCYRLGSILMHCIKFIVFFFFQAEDGIRDRNVTGVQTCALPILSGLNAGRWHYIFSLIRKFRTRRDLVLPDRQKVTMTVPFMRAYTELLVQTCHKRGAHAMGGMAPFIPTRKNPEINEKALAQTRADKEREAADGFDGTWVAHPDL